MILIKKKTFPEFIKLKPQPIRINLVRKHHYNCSSTTHKLQMYTDRPFLIFELYIYDP